MSAAKEFANAVERGGYRLTVEERERIVELKLHRFSVRQISETTRHSPQTIKRVWDSYLAKRASQREGKVAVQHVEALERLDFLSDEAHRNYLNAKNSDNLALAAKFLGQEAKLIETIAKLSIQNADKTSPTDPKNET